MEKLNGYKESLLPDIRIAARNLALATFLNYLSELERNVAKANSLCTNSPLTKVNGNEK